MKKTLLVAGVLLGLVAGFVVIAGLSKASISFRQPEQSFSKFSSDKPLLTVGNLGLQLIFHSIDSPIARIMSKMQLVQEHQSEWIKNGGEAAKLQSLMQKVSQYGDAKNFREAEKTADEILALIGESDKSIAYTSENVHRKERDGYIADAKKLNLSGIEEYIGWSVVEPKKNCV